MTMTEQRGMSGGWGGGCSDRSGGTTTVLSTF